jgi:endogenous inhibitor of DNA gyrase (YacG/DUF329 family)
MNKKVLKVKCPRCQKEFSYYDSKFRPFCTDRCKLIDMGQWLDNSFTIATTESVGTHLEVDEFEIDEADQGFGNLYDDE